MNRIYIMLAALLANIALISLASCSDDENSGGQPVIECVRLTDPEKADSTFTDATVGQMILIQGRNLNNALNVYINNQDCYFNSNYNTSTHLIVTIPADLIVRGMDENVPLEIRIETTHGTASYPFHVIAGYPSLEQYKADLELNADGIPEMRPGQEVTLVGKLLHEIEHIYVADLDTVPLAEVTEWSLNDDCTTLTIKMPQSEIPAYGVYVLECYAGKAYCGFSKSPMEPEVYDVSTDMPIPGQKVVIYGKYLTNLTAVNLCGEIDIDINTVETTEAMDKLTFTMPEQLPTAESNGILTVTTLGGRATLPFYRYDWIYEDFDGNGTTIDWGWGTNNFGGNPAWGWPALPASCPITMKSGNFAYFEAYTSWWDHNFLWNAKATPEGIDPKTPLSKIELRYEVYLHELPTIATTMTSTITVFKQEKAGIPIVDRATGETMPGQWMSVAVPLTEFAPSAATYADICALNVGDGDFKIYLGYDNAGDLVIIAYDNFRLYVKE